MSILLATLCLLANGPARAEVSEVEARSLDALASAKAVIVDVRREDEWRARGMHPEAHGLTFFDERGGYDVGAWLEALSALVGRDEPLVLICATGVRSKRIADLLDGRLGFTAVHNVTDGFEGWLAEGGEGVPFTP